VPTLSGDLAQFVGEFLLVLAGLLPIVNPVASAPMFLAMTRGADAATRAQLARTVAINSTLLLVGAFAVGAYVLKIFGLSVPIVELAGSAVLCRLGWTMLNDPPPADPANEPAPKVESYAAKAFYPLTLPVTVDPGVLAVAIALGANHSRTLERAVILETSALIAIAIVGVAIFVAYRYSLNAAHWLGHSRVQVVTRLCAFIVLCIGVQIGWNGIRTLHGELDAGPAAAAPATPALP
jgi:multiple antibiotic resistance protein